MRLSAVVAEMLGVDCTAASAGIALREICILRRVHEVQVEARAQLAVPDVELLADLDALRRVEMILAAHEWVQVRLDNVLNEALLRYEREKDGA